MYKKKLNKIKVIELKEKIKTNWKEMEEKDDVQKKNMMVLQNTKIAKINMGDSCEKERKD